MAVGRHLDRERRAGAAARREADESTPRRLVGCLYGVGRVAKAAEVRRRRHSGKVIAVDVDARAAGGRAAVGHEARHRRRLAVVKLDGGDGGARELLAVERHFHLDGRRRAGELRVGRDASDGAGAPADDAVVRAGHELRAEGADVV